MPYDVDPALLAAGGAIIAETLTTRLFRSVCPVTGQPDHRIGASSPTAARGSIATRCCATWCPYRCHAGFHEHCVERIFVDVAASCRCEVLSVPRAIPPDVAASTSTRFAATRGVAPIPRQTSPAHRTPVARPEERHDDPALPITRGAASLRINSPRANPFTPARAPARATSRSPHSHDRRDGGTGQDRRTAAGRRGRRDRGSGSARRHAPPSHQPTIRTP